MVEEILVKEQLTKEMIDVGGQLVDALAESGLPITLAMWSFTPESNKWRLPIASPIRATAGSGEIYRRIHEAEKQLGPDAEELLRWAAGTVSTEEELVQAITSSMPVSPGSKAVRLTRGAFEGASLTTSSFTVALRRAADHLMTIVPPVPILALVALIQLVKVAIGRPVGLNCPLTVEASFAVIPAVIIAVDRVIVVVADSHSGGAS